MPPKKMCQKCLAFFYFFASLLKSSQKKREAEEEEEEKKSMSKNPPPPPPTTTTTDEKKVVGLFTADRRGAPTRALQRAFKKARCAAASKSSSSFRGAP